MMELHKISIKNYRQFRDVKLEFNNDPNKNFTIIKGNNGAGKTTLLNALSWCLYGKEIHDYGDDSSMQICNNKSLKLAENNSNVEVFVELEFIDDDGISVFRRSKIFRKKEDDLIANAFGDKFEFAPPGGELSEDNAVYERERRIPEDVEDYFFFDGARLSEYFQTTSNRKIKDAVMELSQLNLVLSLYKNLNNVQQKYIDKQRKIAPSLGRANDELLRLEGYLNDHEFALEKAEKETKFFSKKLKEIDQALIDMKASDVTEKAREDKKLRNEIETNQNKLYSSLEKRRELILKSYPYVFSYTYFDNFLKYGEDTREKGFIPPKYKRSFLEDMLRDGKCICGVDLNKDEEHRKAIEKLLEETNPLTDNAENVTVAIAHIKEVILKRINNFKPELESIKADIEYYERIRDKKIEERKAIKAFLENYSVERVRELTESKEDYEKKMRNSEQNIGRYKSEINSLNKKIGKWKQVKAKEAGLMIENEEYDKKIEFCKEAIKSAKIVRQELTEEMRSKVEALTKEKFIKIIWKEEEFVDIRLDEDYGVFIKNRTGKEERPGDLSDGEKLCLGLCFMSALHNISGFDLPIVMDTPLGNLDVDLRHNIAKFLPEFVQGKQIILLVTGTEYTDDFRETLSDNISKEYTIKWSNSEDGKESEVI